MVVFNILLFLTFGKRIVNTKTLFPVFIALIATLQLLLYNTSDKTLVKSYAVEWMFSDISCFASVVDGKKFQRVLGLDTSSQGEWASKEACTFLNRSNKSNERNGFLVSQIPSLWTKIVKQDPQLILDSHYSRNSYLIPPPFGRLAQIPFIHTNIEFADRGINWLFPETTEIFRNYPRAWNWFPLRSILAWSGLWLLIILIFAIGKTDDLRGIKVVFLMALSISIILFVSAPIPDARYALFTIIAGQLIVLFKLLSFMEKKLNSRKQKRD
jgi:hypothetical protein